MDSQDDKDLIEAVDQVEDDFVLEEVYNRFQRQRDYQRRLIEQSGGSVDAGQQGRFEVVLRPHQDRTSAKHGVRERHFRTHIGQVGNFIDRPQLVQVLEQDMANGDRLYFTVGSNRLNYNFQGWGLTAQEWRQGGNKVNEMFNRLAASLNSNEQFEMNDSFDVSITRVRQAPRGAGKPRRNKPGHRATKVLKLKKRSIIPINNVDELCCARALVTAKALVDQHPSYQNIRKGNRMQQVLAYDLHRQAGVPEGDCGYAELKKFQEHLKDYRIVVVFADRRHDVQSFSMDRGKPELILLHSGNHYDVITSLAGFLGTSYVCAHCHKGYDHVGYHKCALNDSFCTACRQQDCKDFLATPLPRTSPQHRCHHCRRAFFGPQCYENHLTYSRQMKKDPGNCVCLNIRRCAKCFDLLDSFDKIRRHKCGHSFCPCCEEYLDLTTHQCYIMPPKKRKRRGGSKNKKAKRQRGVDDFLDALALEEDGMEKEDERKPTLHIYMDIESMQIHGMHQPNLLVCGTDESEYLTEFHGRNCVADFMEFVEECTEEGERYVTVIAHNFQGYDGYFIMEHYYGSNQICEQIRNGAKLMQVVHDSVRFIDSLNFFQMPLSSFPKTFGLTELNKGFFPHLFNLPHHQDYVEEIPAKDYFMVESMSLDKKEEFESWHADQRKNNVVFDFQKELVEYCRSDVKLLMEGCMVFQKQFQEYTGFNPYEKVTLASACNEDLRRNHLIKNAIASEPVLGWGGNNGNQSKVALEWLHWQDHKLRQAALAELSEEDLQAYDLMEMAYNDHAHPTYKHYIPHGACGGEFKLPETNLYVDGYHAESGTVYQFHGCFWHGCQTCFPNRHERHFRLLYRTPYDVYEKTKQTTQKIRDKGFKLIEIWECEWNRQKQTNQEIADYVNKLEFVNPLNPRDAFFGGRSNATKLYHRTTENEKLHYIDYTSLYPFINKTACYPRGHPIIISQPDTRSLDGYFGLVKCKIKAPYGLYHPVFHFELRESSCFLYVQPVCKRNWKNLSGNARLFVNIMKIRDHSSGPGAHQK